MNYTLLVQCCVSVSVCVRALACACSVWQAAFCEKVHHTYIQKRKNKFEVTSGFYTDQMMKDDLKFTPQLS